MSQFREVIIKLLHDGTGHTYGNRGGESNPAEVNRFPWRRVKPKEGCESHRGESNHTRSELRFHRINRAKLIVLSPGSRFCCTRTGPRAAGTRLGRRAANSHAFSGFLAVGPIPT